MFNVVKLGLFLLQDLPANVQLCRLACSSTCVVVVEGEKSRKFSMHVVSSPI